MTCPHPCESKNASCPQRRIKAVLFDLDGTLLDTEVLSDKAILHAFGMSLPKHIMDERRKDGYRLPWEIKKKIVGLRGSEWIPMVISYAKEHWGVAANDDKDNVNGDQPVTETNNGKLPPPPSVDELWKLWEENLNSFCEEITKCPGAAELVSEFAKRGYLMAIATSSRQKAVSKKRVRHEEIFQHMKYIVAGDDPGVKRGKPNPDIYLEAARRLNVDPSECIVFEDAISGARSGKSAGCYVVAVPDSRYSKEEKNSIFSQTSDVILDSLWDFDGKQLFGIDINMKAVKQSKY